VEAAENPWVLEIIGLPGFQPALGEPWLIASADSIEGFDAAAVRLDISGIADAFPLFSADQFVLSVEAGNLMLQVVPEPASWLLALVFVTLQAVRPRA